MTVTITYLNCYSVNLATGTQNLFTGAKLIAIFIVVVGGLIRIVKGEVTFMAKPFAGTSTSFSDLATAFYSKYRNYFSLTNNLHHFSKYNLMLQENTS